MMRDFPPFNYALMEILCKELQEKIIHFKIVNCLPNDLRRFFLVFQRANNQEALFFCFTPLFIRFHLSPSIKIPKSSSSHPLFSFLKDATLNQVSLLQQDRILQLTFATPKGERRLIAEFFSKHPNYYLVKSDGLILFALHPLAQTHYQLPPSPPVTSTISPWHSHQEVEQAYEDIEKQWEFTKEKQTLQNQLSQKLKKMRRKEQELLESLKQCAQWSNIQHEGDLIKTHLASIKKGSSSFQAHDWATDQPYELKLDPLKTPQEEMALRYKRAKKLEAGQIPLTQQLDRIQKELFSIEQQQQKLQHLQSIEELALFKSDLPPSLQHESKLIFATHPSSPIYREYQSAQGVKIWVGKNAKANDRLTFQLANGRDWWLHASGCPGSHVIIRLGKDHEPDPETLKDALQLALYYSKARSQGEGEICYTQRKYVSRLGKGKTGLAQIAKHQTVWIRSDPVRLQALKERLNVL
jgi:predicted ribosome quality control (RQC) complex YloA/Tae2 family protein